VAFNTDFESAKKQKRRNVKALRRFYLIIKVK